MAVSFTFLGANYGNTATLFIASFIATSSPATSKPSLDRSGMCCNHCSPVSCSHWSSIRSLKSRLAISPPCSSFSQAQCAGVIFKAASRKQLPHSVRMPAFLTRFTFPGLPFRFHSSFPISSDSPCKWFFSLYFMFIICGKELVLKWVGALSYCLS